MLWNQIPNVKATHYDGYVNMLNKYGTKQDNSTAYQFSHEGIIPDIHLTEQYELNGLFAKIIDTPVEEAVKYGFNLGLKSQDAQSYIDSTLDRLEWENKASQAMKWARLYGGAIIVMLADDGGGIDEPLNWKKVRSIEELRVYERAVVTPDYSSLYNYNPDNPLKSATSKFGTPEYYQVNSIYGQFWVHESRCLIFRNGILPERTMQPCYRFWGMPEYLRIKRELREASTSHSTGVKMLERSVQAIYKMRELSSLLQGDEGMDIVIRRLQAIDMARGILNSIAIDNDGEDYDFKTIPFSGVKDVIDTTCNMLSAVTNIPQTILFGRSPSGENSTGESDLENYYNYVERIQKLMLQGNLRTLIDIIIRVGLASGKLTDEPDVKVEFNPLWSMSDKEKAEIEKQKADAQHVKAQTAQIYIEIGSLDPSEVRKGLAREEEFDIEGLLEEIGETGEDIDIWGRNISEITQQNNENPLTTGSQSARLNEEINNLDGGPGSGRYPKGSGQKKLSATGANTSIPDMSSSTQNRHKKHLQVGKSYPGMSMSEYVKKASALARSPVGGDIQGYRGADKSIVRYNKVDNDFVKAYNTGVATMFKPDLREVYYERQIIKDGGVFDD